MIPIQYLFISRTIKLHVSGKTGTQLNSSHRIPMIQIKKKKTQQEQLFPV